MLPTAHEGSISASSQREQQAPLIQKSSFQPSKRGPHKKLIPVDSSAKRTRAAPQYNALRSSSPSSRASPTLQPNSSSTLCGCRRGRVQQSNSNEIQVRGRSSTSDGQSTQSQSHRNQRRHRHFIALSLSVARDENLEIKNNVRSAHRQKRKTKQNRKKQKKPKTYKTLKGKRSNGERLVGAEIAKTHADSMSATLVHDNATATHARKSELVKAMKIGGPSLQEARGRGRAQHRARPRLSHHTRVSPVYSDIAAVSHEYIQISIGW